MRFEIRETVQTPDSEVVLRALEMCSRDVSTDVVRFGDQITLRGVGPSPRSKNKHDTTVFRVNAVDDKTIIQGEVNFQASALLGEASQQDVVRSKLEDLFEQMKAQIQLDSLRVAAYAAARKSAASSARTAVVDRPEEPGRGPLPTPETGKEDKVAYTAPETLVEAMAGEPDLGWGAAAIVGEQQAVAEPQKAEFRFIPEPKDNVPPVQHFPSQLKDDYGRVIAPEMTLERERLKDAGQTVAREQVVQPKPAVELVPDEPTWTAGNSPYRLRIEDDQASGWKRLAMWTTTLVVLLAMAGAAYFFYFHRLHRGAASSQAPIAAQKVDVPVRSLPAVDSRKHGQTAPATLAAPPPEPIVEPPASSADLRLWLQSWAASMQTRDANAQAAFYADRLDRYLDQRNVGRGAVLRDREATIRMRKGLWTVKMEDIVIERQTASEAEVRLMKHFIDQPERSEILESFVPTRLTLKRINGQWKITSEQDQPTISITPWKAQGSGWQDREMPGVEAQPNTICGDSCAS